MSARFLPLHVTLATWSLTAAIPAAPAGRLDDAQDLLDFAFAPKPVLEEVQVLTDEQLLRDVCSVVVAPGGRHAYAAAFNSNTVVTLDRDPRTGRLTVEDSHTDHFCSGMVAFRLSPDGKFGAGSAFRSASLVLYSRDPKTGALKVIDHHADIQDPGMNWCIDNTFSPDGRHVYAIGSAGITVFAVAPDGLKRLQSVVEVQDAPAPARVMAGGRGIAMAPCGEWLASTWNGSGTLVIHRRDPDTGLLTHQQTLRNGGDIDGLAGVMRVAVNRTSEFVYTSGGRFGGQDAVCVFRADRKGNLEWVQSLTGEDLPEGFSGGNEISIAPGREEEVAVACTNGDRVARFLRNPEDGTLRVLGSQQPGEKVAPGPAGVGYSPDGRFLYAADEKAHAVVAFSLR